jgi:hypothetical protein
MISACLSVVFYVFKGSVMPLGHLPVRIRASDARDIAMQSGD